MPVLIRLLLPLLLLLTSTQSWAEDDFLPVHEAFKVRAEVQGNQIHYTWTIADGYYLYQHRFGFDVSENSQGELGEPSYEQEGKWKDDPIFGRVLVFYGQVEVRVPVLSTPDGFIEVDARYQGCADKGLCYIPQTYTDMFQVDPAAISANPEDKLHGPDVDNRGQPIVVKSTDLDTDDAISLEGFLSSSSFLTIVGMFFLIGIGLTFTPCVLPMIPILSSIIVGQGTDLSRGAPPSCRPYMYWAWR